MAEGYGVPTSMLNVIYNEEIILPLYMETKFKRNFKLVGSEP